MMSTLSTITWKSPLSEELLLHLFATHAHLEGTVFLHSGDGKGISWLALSPKRISKGTSWEEASRFVKEAQTSCFGFFSYEMGNGGTYTLYEPSRLLRFDPLTNQATLWGDWEIPQDPSPLPLWNGKGRVIQRSDTHESYLEKVQAILEAISCGDVYQVNLSQEFTIRLEGNSVALWLELVRQLKPSFSSYLQCGEQEILSLSPELFVKQEGREVSMMPIKGTLPSNQPFEQLLSCEKNLAELAMIVDLYRNDLSRYAARGSVQVPRGVFPKTLRDVHHLFAEVRAFTSETLCPVVLLRSLFPAGSISGCPKIASMQFIAKLETSPRGVYTGAIGRLHPSGEMEMSVPIRTLEKKGDQLTLRLGGGVVADSDPEEEYQETLTKGRTFFDTLQL
jgi:anthranilate/para-aminobenzoate synthase component I